MEWILQNKEWIFSGIGVLALSLIMNKVLTNNKIQNDNVECDSSSSLNININNNQSFNSDNIIESNVEKEDELSERAIDIYKNSIKILFVDDDTRFKVAKILHKSGWVFTKLVKDIESLDDRDIKEASILFIDVQGVGIALGFQDEGLGLALALKEKYPDKYVVIYSAETQGDRFHEALRKADSFLPKNADPYEFQKIVEQFISKKATSK